jgi:seryl-tRNA synthetase
VAIEMGRPSIGARFRDVEILTKTVSRFNIEFADHNPMTALIVNKKTGEIDPTVLNEKVLSCIIEFEANTSELADILDAIREISHTLDTVFSLCVICKVDENDNTIVETEIVKKGFSVNAASSKTNVGLGRPRYEDRVKGGAAQ